MGRHQTKKARMRVRFSTKTQDPRSTQTVTHSCGHTRTYTDLPKFDPIGVQNEVEILKARVCSTCNKQAKDKIKAKKLADKKKLEDEQKAVATA